MEGYCQLESRGEGIWGREESGEEGVVPFAMERAGERTLDFHCVGSVASRMKIGVRPFCCAQRGISLLFIQPNWRLTYCRVCSPICPIAFCRRSVTSSSDLASITGTNSRYPNISNPPSEEPYQSLEISQK